MKSILLKRSPNYLIWILPVIFLILAILIHFSYGKFYMTCTDPEYFHLFNGLNISMFNLAVDYIAHPGTTLQMIIAWSAHIVNLIEPGNNLITNALNDPEQYLHGANILLNILTGLSIFALGFYVYKYTKNIFMAIMLQLMPFSNYKILIISGRILPETALIAPLLLLVLLSVKYLYDHQRNDNLMKYIIGFAVIGGLGIAGKLSYLPFAIIPLIILPNSSTRIRYIGYTVLAVFVFAFPVFMHPVKSWEWFGSLFVHSGKYGAGSADIIDISLIPARIGILYNMDKTLFILIGIAGVLLIVFYFIPWFRRKSNLILTSKILFAFLLAFLITLLLIAKHFEAHYFIPFLLFKIFFLYLISEMVWPLFDSQKVKRNISVAALLVAIILIIPQLKDLKFNAWQIEKRASHLAKREFVLKQYNTAENPLIIASHYRGSPFIQSAMVAGCLMSGSLKTTFINKLAEKYPGTYFYFDWTDSYAEWKGKFYFWDKFRDAKDFIDVHKPAYIFIGEGQENSLPLIMERIRTSLPEENANPELLQEFHQPDEYFYKVSFTKKEPDKDAFLNTLKPKRN